MTLSELKIVFMGTPEFAVASLNALMNSGCRIVGVITAPDKPAGRGLQPNESAVKKYARSKGLNILQPLKLKDPAFLDQLRELNADLFVVVAFRMLPEQVWNMPPMGTVNLHGSLLPQYRGAAPINWAIINGEKTTGVTTFRLTYEIDTGDILMQEPFPIGDNETAGEVHDRMKEIGAKILVQTIEGLANGTLRGKPQVSIAATTGLRQAPRIHSETCRIDWNKSLDEVYNLIRGLSPYPTAFTYLNGKILKIYKAGKEGSTDNTNPGASSTDGKTYLKFACANGYIHALEVQLEGKKRLPVGDFLRGYRF